MSRVRDGVTMSHIIIAFDFDDCNKADVLLEQLDPRLCKIKIGKEMFARFGPSYVDGIIKKGYDVFLDLKFFDIPTTVARACKACAELGIWMLNVHALGGKGMLEAAKEAIGPYPTRLLAVTLLTSFGLSDIKEIGLHGSIASNVKRLATLSHDSGLDGVICAPSEVKAIKKDFGANFLTVTPGIRLTTDKPDDQKRIMTPIDAIRAGSDYLVIGRPITKARDPAKTLVQLNTLIKEANYFSN